MGFGASLAGRFLATAALTAASLSTAGAEESVPSERASSSSLSPDLCRNKANLLARVLASDFVVKISEEGAAPDRSMIEEAQATSDSIGPGVVSPADCARIDEALRLVSAAASSSGVRSAAPGELQAEYITRARQFDAYVQAVSLPDRSAWPEEIRRRFAAAQLKAAQAAKLAEDKHFGDAKSVMDSAYQEMLEVVRALNDGKMVVHELIFHSPDEEYVYEKERNRSYEMLLQIAVDKSETSEELRAHITQVIAENNQLRLAAEARYDKGEPVAAIREFEAASRNLAKALRLTGVMVWE